MESGSKRKNAFLRQNDRRGQIDQPHTEENRGGGRFRASPQVQLAEIQVDYRELRGYAIAIEQKVLISREDGIEDL